MGNGQTFQLSGNNLVLGDICKFKHEGSSYIVFRKIDLDAKSRGIVKPDVSLKFFAMQLTIYQRAFISFHEKVS